MTFKITKTSDETYSELKEISTIEELMAFRDEVDKELIITDFDSSNAYEPYKWCIEIYDTYRE